MAAKPAVKPRPARKPHSRRVRINKNVLGHSIDSRPEKVKTREKSGHWETDLVIGSKRSTDKVLLTMAERKNRQLFISPLPDGFPSNVKEAVIKQMSLYSEHIGKVFKTLTTESGVEFSQLSNLEDLTEALVYYAHLYSSYVKGRSKGITGSSEGSSPKGTG